MKLIELLKVITPLPWRFAEMDNDKIVPTVRLLGRRKHDPAKEICLGRIDAVRDAQYACHAANVVPDLVAALQLLLEDQRRPKSELSRCQFEFCEAALAQAENLKAKGAS
ncbi:MAG: hypothetical protein HY298_20940 [Verrucomicrobia bacterium]|nr:hypothetical protein [Verrucomicrobiota bacterium]